MKCVLWIVVTLGCLLSGAYLAPDEFVSQSSHELSYPQYNKRSADDFQGFPKSYEMEYVFTLPYTRTFQAAPVEYVIHAWVDAEDEHDTKTRVDSAGGLDSTITTKDWQYMVNPRLDTKICSKSKPPKPHHSHRYILSNERGLPHDMANWTYIGDGKYEGKPCKVYKLTETFYERKAFYDLYVGLDGAPLYLSSLGQNYFTGAHFDEYIVRFTKYIPGVPDASVFDEPEKCKNDRTTVLGETWHHPMIIQLNALIPRVIKGHPEYDEFVQNYNRVHPNPHEYQRRMKIFLRNKEYVEQHNQRNDATYVLELNHFADWTDEEFLSLKTGGREETEEVEKAIAENTFIFESPVSNKNSKSFTWAGSKADGVVKDQAICGSCWAFAAIQAFEGQWFVAANESLSLSEQQIVDCAWNYFNWACEGGFPALGMVYAVQAGGIMSEMQYTYDGYDNYCRFNKSSTIAKFQNIGIVKSENIESAKSAIKKFGPLAVSIDAGHLDFRFYKSGVYTNPKCKAAHTNHAVSLLGYGHERGMQYWQIKNSWSMLWGDKGYMKVNMDHDCGITKRPVLAIADKVAAAKARDRSLN